MAKKLRSGARQVLKWTAAIAIPTLILSIVSEIPIQILRSRGFYDDPGQWLGTALIGILEFLSQTWVVALLGVLVGLAGGGWLDYFLRRTEQRASVSDPGAHDRALSTSPNIGLHLDQVDYIGSPPNGQVMYAIVVSGTNEHSKSLERVKVSASASTDEREFLPFKLLWTGDLDPQQEFEVVWFKVRSDHTAGTICYVTADGQNEFVKRVHIHMTISAKDVAERVSNYVLNTNRPEFSHLTLEADTDIP